MINFKYPYIYILLQILRNYSKCDLAHCFFKGKGKEEHVKECIRPESLIKPRSIRKLSTDCTGPTIHIKVQAKKKRWGAVLYNVYKQISCWTAYESPCFNIYPRLSSKPCTLIQSFPSLLISLDLA